MKNKTAELSSIISKDLGILEISDEQYSSNLRKSLIEAVNQLLDRDFNKLINILYRMDISEEHIKLSLSLANSEDIAPAIADLIIAREIEKVKTRREYSGI